MFQVQAPASEHQIAQSLRHVPHPVHFSPAHFASPQLRFRLRGPYLSFEADETQLPRLKISTHTHAPHIAMRFIPTNALESVANAHTAADLHVRPVS